MAQQTAQTDTKSPTSPSSMAAAMKMIGFDSADLTKAADILADEELMKAAHSAQALTTTELVQDRWTEGHGHAVPTREEIRTGPPQASSGGGAERFVREYSNPAPQDGLTQEAMRLQEMLGSMRAYMRSLGDQVSAIAKTQGAYTTILGALVDKMASTPAEVTATDEIVRFAAQCTGKAQTFYDAARQALAKAVSLSEDIGELTGDARHARKAEIKATRGHAVELLVKAQESALAACSGGSDPTIELRKSIDTLIDGDPTLKAKAESMREKMREKDEKACSKKALKKSLKKFIKKAAAKVASKTAKPAEVAKTQQQADKQDPENKNQDDASVTTKGLSADEAAMLKKAVDGTAMLQGTVADLMAALSGRPVTNNATAALTLVKSDTGAGLLDQMAKVEKAIADGFLSDTDGMRARDLASKWSAVEAGAISKSMWASLVAKASRPVQELFTEAKVA